MQKITLTMEVTYAEALAIMNVLNNTPSGCEKAVIKPDTSVPIQKEQKLSPSKILPETLTPPESVVIAPTAGKKTKMPSFGRSQEQINTFTTEEQERFDKKTEEQLLSEQRREDRAAKKAEKDADAAEKKMEADAAAAEIARIKSETKTVMPAKSVLPKKPWEI